MGNNFCSGSRKECVYRTNPSSFGMLCKRPYEKDIVVKFETIYSANRKKKKKRRLKPAKSVIKK
jgi:hypothetical protein